MSATERENRHRESRHRPSPWCTTPSINSARGAHDPLNASDGHCALGDSSYWPRACGTCCAECLAPASWAVHVPASRPCRRARSAGERSRKSTTPPLSPLLGFHPTYTHASKRERRESAMHHHHPMPAPLCAWLAEPARKRAGRRLEDLAVGHVGIAWVHHRDARAVVLPRRARGA